jgi:hypothetical protein
MAAFIKYVTFDCADPRRLSAFWSEVTGYLPLTRLVGLGATMVEQREGNGTSWTVMVDPEGNEFCIG